MEDKRESGFCPLSAVPLYTDYMKSSTETKSCSSQVAGEAAGSLELVLGLDLLE
jgi:hypothetical protein